MPWPAKSIGSCSSARAIRRAASSPNVSSTGRGQGRFVACSAGSHPTGRVHPLATELLEQQGFATAGLRSKSWDEFAEPAGPPLDFVFTVCGHAAAERCPLWRGTPITAHWGVADPAAVRGEDCRRRQAFAVALAALSERIEAFVKLPLPTLDPAKLQQALNRIGREPAA